MRSQPTIPRSLSPPTPSAACAAPAGKLPWPALLAGCLALVSCRTYPEETAEAFHAFRRGHFEASMAAFADPEVVDDPFLAGAEAGTAAFSGGAWEDALRYFTMAAAASRELEERALAGPESLGEFLGSWALNDTALSYEGEGFERVYLHCLLAMTYLSQGKLDDVWVEVRLANRLLEAEEKLYDKRYAAGGLGHLISAAAYEIFGEPDQAYIDYERMVEKDVGTQIAGRALVRLASDLNRADELARWEERFGPDIERPPGAANVLVLAAVGVGPRKVEGKLTLPTGDGLISFAVAKYRSRSQPVNGVRLRVLESDTTVRSDVLEDVAAVAAENLDDRMFWMASKTVARGILKRELTQHLGDQYGAAGWLAGNLFAVLSERADLRCWQTLPDTWQACRLFVPPGVHSFQVEAVGGQAQSLGSFELERGETMVILVRTIGTRLYAYPVGGKSVDSPQPTAPDEAAPELSQP